MGSIMLHNVDRELIFKLKQMVNDKQMHENGYVSFNEELESVTVNLNGVDLTIFAEKEK
jgi:hypothetical protein